MPNKLLYAALVCVMLAASAQAQQRLLHDGMAMSLDRSSDSIEIAFIDVPADLRELGVKPGTLLVRGRWSKDILIGEAYAFASGCDPISYPVRGIVDRGGSLTIIGPQPTSCEDRTPKWGEGAMMHFDPVIERQREEKRKRRAREREPEAKPKPKPKSKPAPRVAPTQQPFQYQQWPGWRW